MFLFRTFDYKKIGDKCMTSKKSIFKRVCSCLLAMSFIAAPVFAEETKSDNRALLQVEFLEALGVYDSDRTMMSETEDYLTRENLAVILGGFFGLEPTAPVGAENQTAFLDIEPDHWAAERIQAVADRKIMSGYSDGYFRPDNNATFEQAVKTLVVLAGHDINADFKGGWSAGYMNVANELGITDGVSLGLTDPIRKSQFTQMVVNLLDAEMLNAVFTASGEIHYEHTDKIFMNEVLDIYTQKGVMTANDQTSLLGKNTAEKGFVTIGGINLKADGLYTDYLGCDVKAFYKYDADDNEGTLLWIEEGKKNSILEIDGEYIINPNSNGYFEYEEGRNINKVRIADILSLSVIYNGKLRNFASYQDLAPKNGTVKLIDAQKDGIFETALVWNYYDYIVESVSMQENVINIVDQRGEIAVLEISLTDNYYLDITDGKKQINIESIPSGSIISVAADTFTQDKLDTVISDNKIDIVASSVKILCTGDDVVGTLNSYSNKSYTIDSKVYEFGPYFDAAAQNLIMGTGMIAYLNQFGKIICIELTDGWNYGFVKKVAYLDEEELYLIRIFTSDGDFVDYKVDKLKIDGELRKDAQIIEDLNETGKYYQEQTALTADNRADYHQMIKYFIKNKKLIEIDTLVMNATKEDSQENFRMSKSVATDVELASGNAKVVGDEMFIFPTTAKYFVIPQDMNANEDFVMHSISTARRNTYTRILFDGDDMNIIPLVVEYGKVETKVDCRNFNNYDMIFREKSYELNAEGDPTYFLKGVHLASGNDIEIELENESVYDIYLNDDLKSGDIVSWNQNYKGKATQILRVYNPELGFESGVISGLMKSYFTTGNNLFAGTVINRRDNYMLIRDIVTGKDHIPDIVLCSFSATGMVYVVETETGNIRQGTLAELKTETRYSQSGADNIFLRYEGYTPKRIVIYK